MLPSTAFVLLTMTGMIPFGGVGVDRRLRLPTDIHPTEYKIELVPNLVKDDWKAFGRIWIHINCSKPTKEIIFNIKDITIDKKSVALAANDLSATYKIVNQSYDEEEMYKLTLHKPLLAGGKYKLHMKFTSVLNDLLQGFYRSSYIDSATNETRWLAATQFSPTDARRAFPCWDEPAFKAKFTISLGRPGNMTTRSNMPILHTTQMNKRSGWYWDHYKTTLPMSTYLVGFIVSDLAHSDARTNKPNFEFKVWSRRDALPQSNYAKDIGPRLLEYLEKYFGIDYPLPKLDLVALPDFGFRGMENWGLITFRESAMLYDPEVSTVDGQKNVGIVVGHEIAHQWFGNLVTPQWWDDLWLKEGFATYIGYIALNNIEPTWNMMGQFVIDTLHPVMNLDSLKSTHQISNPVADPKDIRQIFDAISYDKGASIIRMINSFIGDDKFREGLQIYLHGHEYGNAERSQLWEAFMEAVDDPELDIGRVMDSWTLQSGYPVVTVTRNYSDNTVVLTQERFLLSGEKIDNGNWWIPISYTTEVERDFSSAVPAAWMSDKVASMHLPDLPHDKWILVNINQTGFYKVNYDPHNWNLLNNSFLSLPQVTQAQLIDDAYNLAAAGRIPYTVPLSLSENLKNSDEYMPWHVSIKEYKDIYNVLPDKLEEQMKKYLVNILPNPDFTLYTKELPNDYLAKFHVIDIMKALCQYGQSRFVNDAKTIFNQWMSGDDVPILPDLKPIVYCTGVRYGGEAEWNFVWNKYLASNVGSDREDLLKSLACSTDTGILEKYLSFILDKTSQVRKQDGGIIYTAVAYNKKGAGLALKYLSDNWQAIQDHFGLAFNRISKMVESLNFCLNTQSQLNQLQELYNDHKADLGTTELSFLETLEKVQINVNWIKSNSRQIEDWLKKKLLIM
uniref:Aminopeptidase n=1 Tax=Lethocerus distinctifemur TaxID=280095 RepID=A0A2K8JR47_9HEMI|nr:venom M1 protease [Lethocerus distinctifemur]